MLKRFVTPRGRPGARAAAPSALWLTFLLIAWGGLFGGCGNGGSEGPATFPAGVASDVTGVGAVVLWTHVQGSSRVDLEVSREEHFSDRERFIPGLSVANGTVKVEVGGLEEGTRYFYRFSSAGTVSDTGTFATPPADGEVRGVSFAFSGDSNAVFMPFTVLGALEADAPDFFIYLGDTVYTDDARNPLAPAYSREDYDAFYLENRGDPYLRALLGSTPAVTLWDDHEVVNDYAGETVEPQRLQNGLRSFFEHFPVPEDPGEPLRLYRSFRWGAAAEFFVLDERQYRSGEIICRGGEGGILVLPDDACLSDLAQPGRTFLGRPQMEWLKQALGASAATFKFVVGQLPVTAFRFLPYDRWEGYPEERREILDFIRNEDIPNVYFLSTDIHANFVTTVEDEIREIITGPIATDTLQDAADWVDLTLSPDLLFALFFPNVAFHEIDRFAYTLITVRPGTTPPTLLVEIKGEMGDLLYRTEFAAETN